MRLWARAILIYRFYSYAFWRRRSNYFLRIPSMSYCCLILLFYKDYFINEYLIEILYISLTICALFFRASLYAAKRAYRALLLLSFDSLTLFIYVLYSPIIFSLRQATSFSLIFPFYSTNQLKTYQFSRNLLPWYGDVGCWSFKNSYQSLYSFFSLILEIVALYLEKMVRLPSYFRCISERKF